MNISRYFSGLLLALLLLLTGFPEVQAQPRRRFPWMPPPAKKEQERYVELPFSGNLEALVKEYLGVVQRRQEFDELLQELLKDTGKFKVDPELFKKFDLNNPLLQDRLKDLVADPLVKQVLEADPDKKKLIDDFLHQIKPPDVTDPSVQPDPHSGEKPPFHQPPDPNPVKRPELQLQPAANPPPVVNDLNQTLARWMKNWLEDLEDTNVGRMFQHSPAFQQTLQDLQSRIAKEGWKNWEGDMSKWMDNLPRWNRGQFEGMFQLPQVGLPPLNLPELSLPNLHLGFDFPTPGMVPLPVLPTVTANGATILSYIILGLIIVVVVALVTWQLGIGLARRAEHLRARWRLGPWPVDPRRVATRRELVLAFNHLALLLLGPEAQPCNHRDIARQLREQKATRSPQRQQAVAELTDLYEQARYAPDNEELPSERIVVARRHLCHLAGVASA